MGEKSAFDKLSKEFEGIGDGVETVYKIKTQEKTVEQFRTEVVDALYAAIKRETVRSVSFVEIADYVRAKFCENKIEGLNKALGIIVDASTILVKE